MSNSLHDIKQLWAKDKDYYRKVEVGTGVQSFVKKLLESEEIFNLNEGKLSTNTLIRKNEFIQEKDAKERRRADFYIYITQDIAIPIEVECYGNIKAGVIQLLNYQKDFDKHYGILTDGYEWRFYNNNAYKAFTLDDIFEHIDPFLTFWKEYIKPEFYYLSFFERTGQLALIEETKLHVEDNRQLFFEDITKLIQSFKNKLQIEGYLKEVDKKTREKRAIELTYAYVIQFILYKTLVDNDFDDFTKEFETTVTKIHESLKDKRYKDILGIIEGISANISRNVYRPFTKEQEFIKEKIQELYHSLENSLSDVSPWLDIFIFIKKYNYANVRNEIFGYIYENYLKELYEESKKGQYFTDPAVVNFMLDQIGYTPEVVARRASQDPDSVSIIDPSCGSGTFLYSATDSIVKAFQGDSEEASEKIEKVVTNGVFGLDIEEFPLYLAEMNILMRMLPLIINEKYNNPIDKKIKVFKTMDSVSEFMDTALRNTINDTNVEFEKNKGQTSLFSIFEKKLNLGYSSYVRDEDDLQEMKTSLENQPDVPRRRFDYVIGNPPYIPYNECAKQRVLIFELMKQGKSKLSDIYGVNLHSTPTRQKRNPPKPNFYAFFIALGLALLKDEGKLCFIVPQTILTAGDLDIIRYHLVKLTTIEKVITFSGKMFLGRGLRQNKPVATSSLIFVVTRKVPPTLHEVDIVNYFGSDIDIETIFRNIREGKKIKKKRILQSKLLQSIENWNLIRLDKQTIDFLEEYKAKTNDLSEYYTHSLADFHYKSNFYFDIGYEINEKLLLQEPSVYKYPKLDINFSVKKWRGFWPNERNKNSRYFIKLLTTNQGHNLLDSPFKVLWSYINPNKFHFSSEPLIWARNQICAIGSKNKEEILYLFCLLNSPITKLILSSLLRSENEKDFLISIASVKGFIRVPRITDNNKHLKNSVISLTVKLLDLEKLTLADLVDFSGTLKQKFDKVNVQDSYLVLEKDGEKLELPIKKDTLLVSKIIEAHYTKKGLDLEGKTITLSELVSLPAIDFEKQKKIKDTIDDLVFCLYFNIDIPKNKVTDVKFIKSSCEKNKFYKLVNHE
ncbi:N-6 DNA methylase [Candidatus Gottesmanbacteria bacterium]|nr:N-6 DNA methylase [Candidatus Gottesmanbacteria bacterium]